MTRTRKAVLGFVKDALQTATQQQQHRFAAHPGEIHIMTTIARGGSTDEVDAAFEEVVRGRFGESWMTINCFALVFRALAYFASCPVALRACDIMLEAAPVLFKFQEQYAGIMLWDLVLDEMGVLTRVCVARRIMESAILTDFVHSGHKTPWLYRRFGRALITCLTSPLIAEDTQLQRAAFVRWLTAYPLDARLVTATPNLAGLLEAYVAAGPEGLSPAACAEYLTAQHPAWRCTIC
jgi:hypothetical protein